MPESVYSKVWAANSDLVLQTQSDNKDEAKTAKDQLKKLYLEEFKAVAKPGSEFYSEFYKLATKLTKVLKD